MTLHLALLINAVVTVLLAGGLLAPLSIAQAQFALHGTDLLKGVVNVGPPVSADERLWIEMATFVAPSRP